MLLYRKNNDWQKSVLTAVPILLWNNEHIILFRIVFWSPRDSIIIHYRRVLLLFRNRNGTTIGFETDSDRSSLLYGLLTEKACFYDFVRWFYFCSKTIPNNSRNYPFNRYNQFRCVGAKKLFELALIARKKKKKR